MQYLSRAYQYYSGINPATLTGAIDVIVVKRTDENGETIYSSSPFHVRFGKLQVLRAGEKKVTLHLPNNLPAPHVAPFSMKVGEAGEAFFVIETDDEVPEELQTSPVLGASDAPMTPPASDEEFSGIHSHDDGEGNGIDSHLKGKDDNAPITEQVITEAPFGKTEKQQNHSHSNGNGNKVGGLSSEPTFFDLNADPPEEDSKKPTSVHSGSFTDEPTSTEPSALTSTDKEKTSASPATSSISPSSILNTATSLLPSFLQSTTSDPELDKSAKNTAVGAAGNENGENQTQDPPPNPLRRTADSPEPHPETVSQYVAQHKRALKQSSVESIHALREKADEALPPVKLGDGEPPSLLYKDDAILDMAGYHQTRRDSDEDSDENKSREPDSAPSTISKKANQWQIPVDSLLGEMTAGDNAAETAQLVAFAQDLLASAGSSALNIAGQLGSVAPLPPSEARTSASQTAVIQEIERRLGSLDLGDNSSSAKLAHSAEEDDGQRRIRATSMPAPEMEESSDPSAMRIDIPPQSADYTWEWGGFPMKTPAIQDDPTFPPSAPSDDHHLDVVPSRESLERSNSAPIPTVATTGVLAVEEPDSPRPVPQRLATVPFSQQEQPEAAIDRSNLENAVAQPLGAPGRLKNDEEDPYRFILAMSSTSHVFELSKCGNDDFEATLDNEDAAVSAFIEERVTFQRFIEDPTVVDSPDLVIKYKTSFLTWKNASPILASMAIYRRTLLPPLPPSPASNLPPLSALGMDSNTVSPPASKGYAWSRWWRRGQSSVGPSPQLRPPIPEALLSAPAIERSASAPVPIPEPLDTKIPTAVETAAAEAEQKRYYAKTLRLSSDQLKQLNLKDGPNTITFSVTSSYSGLATCAARIFLWDESDHIVISDIDGTITKSDALGHVFAAIGRDWTHLGVAKLYTDICNNGYKIMYLTSRAIGQADSTRDYLKGIHQGNYQLPEGPVIMSPDRLMASLHREVIMRKPELFKMACLRDIQRLFGGSVPAFYAGFGNRITDAMSYRSVNIPSSRIFTIDSNGEVKMELLELAGYKSSYIHMTDLVDQMFPPINKKSVPEFTDFNYWREAIPDIPIPDLSPPSPALSARSDGSGRLSSLRNFTGLGRRSSRPAIDGSGVPRSPPTRPTSPLVGPAMTADYDSEGFMSEDEEFRISEQQQNEAEEQTRYQQRNYGQGRRSGSPMPGSLPGSYDPRDEYLNDDFFDQRPTAGERKFSEDEGEEFGFGDEGYEAGHGSRGRTMPENDEDVDLEMFDDDLLAAEEMSKVGY